jgi:hypothetical protein
MHIYKRELTEANGTQLVLPAGLLSKCWDIGFPPEGRITRLIVRQSAGASSALTVNLFDSDVCHGYHISDGHYEAGYGASSSSLPSSSSPGLVQDAAFARIIPEQSVLAGATLELREGKTDGGPWSYRNREGTFTVPVRKVYLNIVVDENAAGMEFECAIEAEVGNEAN